jgi:hypothetical protein
MCANPGMPLRNLTRRAPLCKPSKKGPAFYNSCLTHKREWFFFLGSHGGNYVAIERAVLDGVTTLQYHFLQG